MGDLVKFAGFVPESEKVDYYRLADLFALPSRGEGFGIVFLEAMACGVPTMAGKFDGGREALDDGRLGILVDPGSENELWCGIMEGLSRQKGVVPNGLSKYSKEAFTSRVKVILDHWASLATGNPSGRD